MRKKPFLKLRAISDLQNERTSGPFHTCCHILFGSSRFADWISSPSLVNSVACKDSA